MQEVDGKLDTGATAQRPWVQRLKSAASIAVGAGMFALAVYVIHRWAANVSLEDLETELAQISIVQILLATLYSFLSFAALVGYEWYAVKFIGRKLPLRTVAMISFCTQSVAHAVGFAIFVGATIRYKLYAAHHFTLLEVAKIQLFFTTTFGLGCLTLVGGTLLIEPGPLVSATEIPDHAWRLAGTGLLLVVAAILIWGTWFHRPIKVGGKPILLPSARVVLIQIVLGVTDLGFVALALHVLLPDSLGLDYFQTLGIFVAALSLGLVSHVPGSLGVFESAVLVLAAPSPDQVAAVIGALICFRACYYILPLLIGASLFGLHELRRALGLTTGPIGGDSRRPELS